MYRLFTDKNKKVLIGSSLGEVDEIVKAYVKRFQKPIVNIEKATTVSLATSLVSSSSKFEDYELIDSAMANALFYTFLRNNIKSKMIFDLIPEESFSYNTSKNAYEAMNQIRMGKINDGMNNHKLALMISSFENYLHENKYLDEPLIFSNAIDLLINKKIESISGLGFGNNISLYMLPDLVSKLSYLEDMFIKELGNMYKVSINQVSYEEDAQIETHKIKTYGYSNTVKYIVDEIKSQKLNLSDVAIYASIGAYDNLIKAYFDNYGINYAFSSGEDIVCEDFADFLLKVLHFLGNHFNIEHLYALYKNKALAEYKDDEENYKSYEAIKSLKDMRADKEQILYVASKLPLEKRQFIIDLLNLYNEADNVSSLFEGVLDFSLKYTKEDSYKESLEVLLGLTKLFRNFDLNKMNYSEKIDLIVSFISSQKISKELRYNDKSYVLIDSINAKFLPRKYNFFIGLSSAEMTVSEIESPLLSDEELRSIIDCNNYYVKLGTLKNEERITNLNKLIKTQALGSQYFITSIYDSVEFKPLSKSAFYLNLKGEESNTYYAIEDINLADCDEAITYLYPQTASNINKVNNTTLSPSAIETIVNCPLRHMYELIYDEIELDEHTDRWLKAGDEGTFAHAVLEKYFKNVKGDTFDSNLFDNCLNEVYSFTKETNAFSDKNIQEIEMNRVKDMVLRYLDRYYSPMNASLYKPIEFELKINKADGVIYSSNTNYKVYGIIDRVDAYVDSLNDLRIRIVDYKTYSDNSFNDHEKHNLFTQVVLYPCMINEYVNKHYDDIASKVGNFNKKESYDVIFVYELLKQNKAYTASYDNIKETINDSLDKYIELIKEPTWQNFLKIYTPNIAAKSQFEEGRCSYCRFADYCRLKIQKGDSQIWNK